MRRRSKTEEQSDDGVYQSPCTDPNAYGVALPMVGFDYKKYPTGIFFSAQGDTKGESKIKC